jgi:glucokinase
VLRAHGLEDEPLAAKCGHEHMVTCRVRDNAGMTPTRRRLVGGLDLGGTKIQAVLLDGRRSVVADVRRPTPQGGGPQGVIEELAATLAEACAQVGVEARDLPGVGVGSPGAIDARRGIVSDARNLPGEGAPIRLAAGLRELTGTRAYIENDVTVGVKAEYVLGAARRSKSLLGVWWGTGVGGGLVLDGKTWEGQGAAGELGHVVVKVGGARCTCGRDGCLEAYAGRGAMEIRARQLHKRGRKTDLFKIMEKRGRARLQSGIWARALEQGDPLAIELVDRAVKALGAGVASAVNLLDVETVVIGGGLGTRLGEPYVERIREAMQPHLFVTERRPKVCGAALGDLGGAIGAAPLVPKPAAARAA